MKILKRLYQTIWSYNRDHRVVYYFLPVFSVTVNSPICFISQLKQLNNNNFQKHIHFEVYILVVIIKECIFVKQTNCKPPIKPMIQKSNF